MKTQHSQENNKSRLSEKKNIFIVKYSCYWEQMELTCIASIKPWSLLVLEVLDFVTDISKGCMYFSMWSPSPGPQNIFNGHAFLVNAPIHLA